MRRTGAAPGRLALAGALVGGAAGVALSYRAAAAGPLGRQGWAFLVVLGAWWAAFALGAACVMRLPVPVALGAVAAFGVAMRVAALAGPPVLTDDLYRYAWDAKVQAAGVDPYRHPPPSPQLAPLRDPWLWPDDAGCAERGQPPGCTRINRPQERTIYPPLAQAWFRIAGAVANDHRDRGWQVAALLVDLVFVGVLALALSAFGRDPRAVVLYAWCPLAVLETAQNAHVDGLAVIGCLGALWAAHRGRPALAGVLLGAATLVKLYPAALLPVLWRRRPGVATAAFAATLALAYAPHVAAVGPRVLGYLPGYLAEERYADGGRFLLVGLVGLRGLGAQAVVAAALGAAALAAARSVRAARLPVDVAARRLLGAAFLLATPVQPWYGLLLAGVATLGAAWWWLAVALAAYPGYMAALLGPGITPAGAGRPSYASAAVAVASVAAVAAARRRRAEERRFPELVGTATTQEGT